MIPILDFQQHYQEPLGFAANVGAACRDTGFFLLQNHSVPDVLCAEVFVQADAFFALPQPEKEKVSILNTPHFRGWGRAGIESLDENRPEVDTKETFNVGLDLALDDPRVIAGAPFRGVNQWPNLPEFADTMLDYYRSALTLGIDLHRAFARDLGLEIEHFTQCFHDPLAALRLLRYPPLTGGVNEIGAGAHTDYGAITLLMSDGEPGLQVRPRGQDWVDVPNVKGAYIVNIGDCLMRWTNDIYISTPHRVLPPKRQRRSVAMFIEANPDTIVQALPGTGTPKYSPIRAADYLMSRLDATYSPKEFI